MVFVSVRVHSLRVDLSNKIFAAKPSTLIEKNIYCCVVFFLRQYGK